MRLVFARSAATRQSTRCTTLWIAALRSQRRSVVDLSGEALDMKMEALMATKKRQAPQPAIPTIEQFGEDVIRRRAALAAPINIPRNSGERRTESKKALLAAIETAGGKW